MNLINRIFRILFSFYGLLVFVASFFIVFPIYFIVFNIVSKEKSPYVAHKVSQVWAKFLLITFFIKVKVENKNLIDPLQTYVFISNHQSQLDILVSAVACENTFRFLAKAELVRIPVIGYVINKLYVAVNRKNPAERTKSMERMKTSLEKGISVWIYPEGTRNKTNETLLPLYDGAFRLAVDSKKPLAVLTIANSRDLLSPLRLFDLSPGIIFCKWSEPISTKELNLENLQNLKVSAKTIMSVTMGELQKSQ